MKDRKHISFVLAGIQTVEFAVIKEFYSENKNISLSINTEFGIKSLEEPVIVCSPEISFLQKNKPFIKIKIACSFSIEESSWNSYLMPDKKSIVFPKEFTDHLLMLSIGTLRGALHAKTEGTLFNRFIVPTVNVVDLYIGNITFEFNNINECSE